MAEEDLTKVAKLEHSPAVRAEVLIPAQSTEVKFTLPFGFAGLTFAIVSMAMCVGPAIVEFFLGLEPDSLDVNPHAQAVMMMVFGLCSVYAMWQDRRRHHSSIPAALGATGVTLMFFTLYVRYHAEMEALSYVLLVIAALLNLNVFMSVLNRTVGQQAREIEVLNQGLEAKVESQFHEIDRLARLKQFLARRWPIWS